MKMKDKKFDELIETTLKTEYNQIKSLNDIDVPPFEETMTKFWNNAGSKNNVLEVNTFNKKKRIVTQVVRISAACILITITSFFFFNII